MKKLLMIVGALFVVFLVVAITVPFFVDVDKYRPEIVRVANQHLNGKLSLGKLKLSLWSGIHIRAESIRLEVNGFDKPLLDTDSFYLEVPLAPLLIASPKVIAVLEKPRVYITKNRLGKMNATSLMAQSSPTTANSPSSPTTQTTSATQTNKSAAQSATASASPAVALPAMVARATLGIRINEGLVEYSDLMTKANYNLNGLDLEAKNLGLGSHMSITFKAPISATATDLNLGGVLKGEMQLKPILQGSQIVSASGEANINGSDLEINWNKGFFKKSNSMPMELVVKFDGTEKDVQLKTLRVTFHKFSLSGSGLYQVPNQNLKLEITSSPLPLASIQDFVPMLAQYGLAGEANLLATISKTGEAGPHASGEFKIKSGAVKVPGLLKAALNYDVSTNFTENSVTVNSAKLTAPDSDIELTGNLRNFQAPQFAFVVKGNSFNVDKVLVLPAPVAQNDLYSIFFPSAYAAPVPSNPFAMMQANPMIANAAGTLQANLKKLIVYDAPIENIQINAALRALQLNIQNLSLQTFDGHVGANALLELKQAAKFQTKGKVNGLLAEKALSVYFPKFKNTLAGKVDADWNLNGMMWPPEHIRHDLHGTMKLSAKNGKLSSIDFKDAIKGVLDKVPMLKNKNAPVVNEGFKQFVADLKFDQGTIYANPMKYDGEGKSFNFTGNAKIFENMNHESFFDIYDPNGILPKEISAGSGPALSLHMTGPITSPQTDYGYTVERLVKKMTKSQVQNLVNKDSVKKGLDKILGGAAGGNKDGAGGNNPVQGVQDQLKKKLKFF